MTASKKKKEKKSCPKKNEQEKDMRVLLKYLCVYVHTEKQRQMWNNMFSQQGRAGAGSASRLRNRCRLHARCLTFGPAGSEVGFRTTQQGHRVLIIQRRVRQQRRRGQKQVTASLPAFWKNFPESQQRATKENCFLNQPLLSVFE